MWGKGWRILWLLPLPLSLLAGDRDPFLPPEDRCQTAQLAQWRYGGAVGHRHYWVGYLLDHRNQWRRVRKEDALPGGWRIHLLTAERVAITTGLDANLRIGNGCGKKEQNMMRWISLLFLLLPAIATAKMRNSCRWWWTMCRLPRYCKRWPRCSKKSGCGA